MKENSMNDDEIEP